MLIDKDIIEKFLSNRCTTEEARLVHHHLSTHPEVLQQYYSADWEAADTNIALEAEHAEMMYRVITGKTGARNGELRKLLPRVAAAAAAVLIAVAGIRMYQPKAELATEVQMTPASVPAEEKRIIHFVKEEKNKTGKQKRIILPDGTIVSLFPEAGIEFKPGFDKNKRDVILHGEAYFEVAKDKERPFTVYSGNLSTTALGTSFKIKNTASAVRVKLITGKVVVRAAKGALPGWQKDIYLLPGQQMHYEAGSSLVNVFSIPTDKKEGLTTSVPHHAPAKEMLFNNTPLQEVFKQLSQHHKVPISWSTEDLDGLSFSGTIFYKDDLSVILKAIAQMNDLTLTVADNGYFLKKAGKH